MVSNRKKNWLSVATLKKKQKTIALSKTLLETSNRWAEDWQEIFANHEFLCKMYNNAIMREKTQFKNGGNTWKKVQQRRCMDGKSIWKYLREITLNHKISLYTYYNSF
jgi:hypothetical protein